MKLKRYMISFIQDGVFEYVLLSTNSEVYSFIEEFQTINIDNPNSLVIDVTDLKTGVIVLGEIYPWGLQS
jgi:hypothetical protein